MMQKIFKNLYRNYNIILRLEVANCVYSLI